MNRITPALLACAFGISACGGNDPLVDGTPAVLDEPADTATVNNDSSAEVGSTSTQTNQGTNNGEPETGSTTDPTTSVRADACGPGPHDFVQMAEGEWETVAEFGMLDGVETQFTFLEGPVWLAAEGVLYFSDFNKNSPLNDDDLGAPSIIWRYNPETGDVTNAFEEGSIRANGMATDDEGNILVADHGARGIGKIAPDGTYTLIAETFDGNPFNAPNDLVSTSDGSIFFTDPTYNSGVDGRETPIGHEGVYRIAPDAKVSLVASGLRRPNGITTSIDEQWLFVSFKDESTIYRYPLDKGEVTGDGEEWITGTPTDGVTVDCAGNLYLAVPGKQLRVYDPTGAKIWDLTGRAPLTNVAFGGDDNNEIFVTEQTRLLRRKLVTPGMPY